MMVLEEHQHDNIIPDLGIPFIEKLALQHIFRSEWLKLLIYNIYIFAKIEQQINSLIDSAPL